MLCTTFLLLSCLRGVGRLPPSCHPELAGRLGRRARSTASTFPTPVQDAHALPCSRAGSRQRQLYKARTDRSVRCSEFWNVVRLPSILTPSAESDRGGWE
uniref:Secreted protein n=1 Tax=Arundo donax TaxID=35708 RepID=A0A0A8XXS3_ARUDO